MYLQHCTSGIVIISKPDGALKNYFSLFHAVWNSARGFLQIVAVAQSDDNSALKQTFPTPAVWQRIDHVSMVRERV